jgi:hypothetical protein
MCFFCCTTGSLVKINVMSLYDTRFPLVDTLDFIFLVILIFVVDSTTTITCAPITLCCSKFLKLKLTKNLSMIDVRNYCQKRALKIIIAHAEDHIFNFIFLTQSNLLLTPFQNECRFRCLHTY